MTRRTITTAGLLAVCMSLPFGILAMLPPRQGFTKANMDRVQKGMTKTEVEAILGQPSQVSAWNPDSRRSHQIYFAEDDGWSAAFFFDEAEIVVDKRCYEADRTVYDRIRRWLPFRFGSPLPSARSPSL